jgi:hypothetical protein
MMYPSLYVCAFKKGKHEVVKALREGSKNPRRQANPQAKSTPKGLDV